MLQKCFAAASGFLYCHKNIHNSIFSANMIQLIHIFHTFFTIKNYSVFKNKDGGMVCLKF